MITDEQKQLRYTIEKEENWERYNNSMMKRRLHIFKGIFGNYRDAVHFLQLGGAFPIEETDPKLHRSINGKWDPEEPIQSEPYKPNIRK